MRPSAETLLALLILILFLKDSVWLLHHDEAVLVRRLRGRWNCGFGARSWQWSEREPYLLNPFLPHQPVFRLRWDMGAPAAGATAAVHSLSRLPHEMLLLGSFAWMSWIAMALLLVALGPLHSTGWALLSLLGLLYFNIVSMAIALCVWRRPLGLDRRALGMLIFECLVCPPYAANIVRRVSALQKVSDDFTVMAQTLLTAAQMDRVKAECLARIDAQIEVEEVDSPDMARLLAARPRFAMKGDHGER